MKFQIAVAACMLMSTVTPKCENIKAVKHEKKDCSDEGKAMTDDEMKVMSAMFDKCVALGDTSSQITCDTEGATTTTYKDKECKTEDKKET